MKSEKLKVVLDEELPKLLEALGLREKLEAGEILCHQCGTPVSFSSIALILPTASGYLFVCSNRACVDRPLPTGGDITDAQR